MDTRDFCFWLQGMLDSGRNIDLKGEEVRSKLRKALKEEKDDILGPYKDAYERSQPETSIPPMPIDPKWFVGTPEHIKRGNVCCK